MAKYDVFVNNLWQGSYMANSVNMAVALYCEDYQTTSRAIAIAFGVVPKAFPSEFA